MAERQGGDESSVGADAPGASAASGASKTVFISYASSDAEVVHKVCQYLESRDVPCWLAPRDVKPGAQYADAIVRAINEAKVLVLVMSASAVDSAHVAREVERAASKRKPIIPFRIDGAALNPELEYFLSNAQWIDAPSLGMAAALAKLTEAVGQGSTMSLPTHPRVHRGDGTVKRVAIAASITLGLAVAIALGVHLWNSNHPGALGPAVAGIPDKSIAVLPFTDMSEKKDQEYFADGMAEEVLDLLAKVPGIRVIGRTSSFQFKGKSEDLRAIGSALGAAYVVEGSVRRSGDRVRVTAQLIGTQDGSHLWSETYDDDVGDVLKVQDRIAAGLVRALQVTVGADDMLVRPVLKNSEGYDLLLRGRHVFDRFDKDGLESAAVYFQQALELDPTSVRAAEWLAAAHEWIAEYGFVPPREGFERARASAQRALELDPRSGPAHSLLASIHVVYDWDWTAAAREHQLALETDRRNSIGAVDLDRALGHWDEAVRNLNSAFAVDPLFAAYHGILGMIRYRTGNLPEAEAELHKALGISPTYHRGHRRLGQIFLAEGQVDAALEEMQRETADGGRDLGLAIVYYDMKRAADSNAALARLIKERAGDRAYQIAEARAYRSEIDEAFVWLDRAYEQKDVELFWIKGDPLLEKLVGDPRYKAFMAKMNLPAEDTR
jgi:TolB-like protein/tetratricopeptide (TPR) repeat protein